MVPRCCRECAIPTRVASNQSPKIQTTREPRPVLLVGIQRTAQLRYFFTVRDGRTYPDLSGYSFAGRDDALGYAKTLAQELYKEPDLRDSFIIITDERGVIIEKVAVAQVPAVSETTPLASGHISPED